MATKNFSVGSTPVLIANDVDDPLLITCKDTALVEFKTAATASAPDKQGHVLAVGIGREALSRTSGLVGYVYATKVEAGKPSVILAVDGSSVAEN